MTDEFDREDDLEKRLDEGFWPGFKESLEISVLFGAMGGFFAYISYNPEMQENIDYIRFAATTGLIYGVAYSLKFREEMGPKKAIMKAVVNGLAGATGVLTGCTLYLFYQQYMPN